MAAPTPRTQAGGPGPLVRIALQVDLAYEVDAQGADFVLNIHAAHTACQTVDAEWLQISQPVPTRLHTDPASGNRRLQLRAEPGHLQVSYRATVDLAHRRSDPARLQEVPVHRLPPAVVGYIYPSRYCQSDRLLEFARREFGHLAPGHARVQAICDWVRQRVSFRSNTSNASTSALDTLVDCIGVCRDFAHLMIALCRALNIPARMATGTDFGADPALGPPDFHAYVEVFLGEGWVVFDPSGTAMPMGLVRIGTGRDAADVAFATIFGGVQSMQPLIRSDAIDDGSGRFVLPHHSHQALSTDPADAP